ncbi:hypothetical protein [Robiginitalea sp. SC105]|uniref:hypothetical protein n=1 Tax=Robiginitalea sp. SC105 TaxID=2762332 RepID=UPI002107E6E3|nr:hypothetical protein [Robiginitalea sp. SC105]
MKRIWKGLPIFLICILLSGCDISDDGMSYHFVTLEITAVDMPESFQLHESYEIGVTYALPNGCTNFEGFDVTSEGTAVRRVVAIGSEFPEENCTGPARELQTSFQFTCRYYEPYLFRFYSGEDESGNPRFIEVEVPVE